MIILRTSDKVPCKIGDLTIWVSPISWDQKISLSKHSKQKSGEVQENQSAMIMDTLIMSIKKVDGFEGEFLDGTPAVLEWVDGKLTKESIEMLVRAIGAMPISRLSSAILTDALAGDIEGFEIDFESLRASKKKNSQ